ncbi:hypothetical protein BDB00DRAFT_873175 [Zychaea mexicana]|uniref:uncharacterized protein n=1 Tax=Zychaea mexicana TaxID=64656 RepID=UPI0022FDBB7B|nr:uncharacterized protein BDB00DRAFT_873175 [Zychaea mexicana]KAI9492596.1 hypothetical protein BDB00DRAFT_873175 [Zychaea mexicana]
MSHNNKIKLYTFPPSLYASIPRLLIAEKNIQGVEYVTVDLSKAENFAPDYLKVNPNHTVPALEFTDERGSKSIEDDSIEVCKQLDKMSGEPQLYTSQNASSIDSYVKDMHDNADVGNPLFFTSRDESELAKKKDMIVPFLQGRVQGFETYSKQAPEHKQLYDSFLQSTNGMIAQYQGKADAKPMFETNAQMWSKAVRFLDKTEELLKQSKGDFIFGDYSLADVHLTAWLYRQNLVRGEENFQGRPTVKAYYERVSARPSFKATWP